MMMDIAQIVGRISEETDSEIVETRALLDGTRGAYRVRTTSGIWIANQRQQEERARMEAACLTVLTAEDGPVPRILFQDERWLVQTFQPGNRLSESLDQNRSEARTSLMEAALSALRHIHDIGRQHGADLNLPLLGQDAIWRQRLASMPQTLGTLTSLPPPPTDREAIAEAMSPTRYDLIKWDARPSNAMVDKTGEVKWFDWEHCGRRDPLDDAAWLLGDEFAPDIDSDIACAVTFLLPDADARGRDEASADLLRFGVLHITVRLVLMLQKRSQKAGWMDWQTCLDRDLLGATADAFRRLCRRAARWSADLPELKPLSLWYDDLAEWCPDD